MAGLAASCALELLALGSLVGFCVTVGGSWGLAEMVLHLTALARMRKLDRATALGRVQGQLDEGENLAPALRMLCQVQLLT